MSSVQQETPIIIAETENFVQLLTLNRPKALNAFNDALFDALAEALLAAADDDLVRVVVLTGNGRAFSAGADLSEMGQVREEPVHGFLGLFDILIDFPKPLIVAVNGLGVGIGATICGLADMTFMAESARLRCPFSALGLTAEAASTYTLPQIMGRQRASWFLLSAEWMSATECWEAGLALEVLTDDKLIPRAMEKARKLAALPLVSLMQTKSLMMAPHREQLKAAARAESQAIAEMTGGPANLEAINAFKEKREPDFSKIGSSK